MIRKIRCSSCNSLLRAPEELLGQILLCPKCANSVTVVDLPTASEDSLAIIGTSSATAIHDQPMPPSRDERIDEIVFSPAIPNEATTTRCPFCLEAVQALARKCKHCGEILDPDLKRHRELVGKLRGSNTDKRIMSACLLCMFFGLLGVQRFYVGKNGSGAAMAILTITGFGLFFSAIWALSDLIEILRGNFMDQNGVKITEWS